MSKLLSMPFLVEKYLKKTPHLSLEEHGAYCLLLFHMWQGGGKLADNDADLTRLLGVSPGRWKKLRERLAPFFESHGGFIMQDRLQKQRNYAVEHSAQAKAKASFAAKRRWEKERGLKSINDTLQAMPHAIPKAMLEASPKQCPSDAILKERYIPLPLSNTVPVLEINEEPAAQSTAVEMPELPTRLNRLLNTNLMRKGQAA